MLVRSLGWHDPLEEGMATHSSTLAWRIPWTEEPGGLQSMGLQRDTIERLNTHAHARVSLTHTQDSPIQPASCSLHQGRCQPLEHRMGKRYSLQTRRGALSQLRTGM